MSGLLYALRQTDLAVHASIPGIIEISSSSMSNQGMCAHKGGALLRGVIKHALFAEYIANYFVNDNLAPNIKRET